MDRLDKKLMRVWVTLALVLWAVSRYVRPAPRVKPTEKLEILAYYENGTGGNQLSSLASFRANLKRLNYVSPYWYSVGPGSKISNGERSPDDGSFSQVVTLARSQRIKLVPLVSNHRTPAGAETSFLREPSLRQKVIDELFSIAKSRGWDGLNVALEMVPASMKSQYVAFVQDLGGKLRSEGMMLMVSAFPPKEMSQAIVGGYDYRQLALHCDRFVTLMYDRHWAETEAGPISPASWVESNLAHLTKLVSPSKLIMAVPLYGYDWPGESRLGKPEYISAKQAVERAAAHGVPVKWDSSAQEAWYSYVENGLEREVYFGSGKAAANRSAMAKRCGLKGLALWRLGFEDDSFWRDFNLAPL
ncbi:MAG: glycosyl hydrolase family 18 protein [Bacillota bacterium]